MQDLVDSTEWNIFVLVSLRRKKKGAVQAAGYDDEVLENWFDKFHYCDGNIKYI